MSLLLRIASSRGLLPRVSDTEREALEAGTVWVDGELFSGRPDFRRILSEPYPELTERERAFLDGPVEEACRRVDLWQLSRRRELPSAAGILDRREADLVRKAAVARRDAIEVDSFTLEEFLGIVEEEPATCVDAIR